MRVSHTIGSYHNPQFIPMKESVSLANKVYDVRKDYVWESI